jgi:alkylresorcinol/alkylpyrone synthase
VYPIGTCKRDENAVESSWMSELLSVATALPPHRVGAADTKEQINLHLKPASAARFCRMVDASGIRQRYTALAVSELVSLRGVQARNDLYIEHALSLGEHVTRAALADAAVSADSIGALLSVSCSGYMMPSLDAHLVGQLGISPAARRIPITELGCSAGVAAIGLADTLLRPPTTGNALVVSVELSSLSGQVEAPTTVDMLANLLFGDAAAAVVVSADNAGRGPEIVAAGTRLWPQSLDQLGVRLTDTGFRAFLSPELPRLIRVNLQPTLSDFLERQALNLDDISFWAIHPGGPKVLDAVGASLNLSDALLRPSWEVLEQYGNLSSASTLFILRHLSKIAPPPPGSLGLMLAFGPGVTCEVVLLRSAGWLSTPR